ncbi:hemolysin family protein [Porticoccus sp. W117]|uniref:CNNM domain-containing protein n=1 Tax=Porticoccus sp. W117 TaxID=3054777 RepID=UPI0025925801|nr:hemolysin family protein [Porticoccus sp. W117]MDM3872455.1 hemolysin family protein [Porticoccus sp. W117]
MTLLLIYLTIAIGVSFLCSILEAVLLSVTPSYVEQVREQSPRRGKQLAHVKTHIDESLSSILILNTFAHTMGAAGVGSQALQVFGPEWETLIAILLTLAILYFSEIIPKTLGATFWRPLSVPSAYTISWLVKIVYPLVWLSTRITHLFSKNKGAEITRDEIIALASISHKDGTLFTQENQYLSNLLSMRDVNVEDILTPRSVVHMLQESLTVTEALDNPKSRQFSRIPTYGNTTDDITGCVFRTDLFEAERNGDGDKAIKELAKNITRVSEKLPVYKMLDMCIKRKIHLALAEDEFGQTSGVVTLEDAIETLLGREIVDESDPVEDMQELAKRKFRDRLKKARKDKSNPQEKS